MTDSQYPIYSCHGVSRRYDAFFFFFFTCFTLSEIDGLHNDKAVPVDLSILHCNVQKKKRQIIEIHDCI